MTELLFSYGTLQKPETQLKLFGRTLIGHPDILKGFKIESIEIHDETFLARQEQKNQRIAIFTNNNQDEINGMLFEVSPEELLFADKYEPSEYKRIKVQFESGKQGWIFVGRVTKSNFI